MVWDGVSVFTIPFHNLSLFSGPLNEIADFRLDSSSWLRWTLNTILVLNFRVSKVRLRLWLIRNGRTNTKCNGCAENTKCIIPNVYRKEWRRALFYNLLFSMNLLWLFIAFFFSIICNSRDFSRFKRKKLGTWNFSLENSCLKNSSSLSDFCFGFCCYQSWSIPSESH